MREGLLHIVIGALFMFAVGAHAHMRVRREAARPAGGLSRPTRALMLLTFGGLGATLASAALGRAWPLDLPPDSRAALVIYAAGLILVVAGAVIVIAVFTGSRKRTWAVDTDRLATTGIYGLTRNPRAMGWFLIYLGIALAAGSWAGVALAVIFLLGYLPWILLEEAALDRHFGDEYRAYRRRTPRFI
jgi:protein-S-isoprenylcysteine O-methyltransferase Ste14